MVLWVPQQLTAAESRMAIPGANMDALGLPHGLVIQPFAVSERE